MRFFSVLIVLLATFNATAQQEQKLPNGNWAYYGEEFYNTLNSKSPFSRELISKILNSSHQANTKKPDIISKSCNKNCYRHSIVGYDSARKIMFGELDAQRDSKGTFVIDVYCGKKFYFRNLDEVSKMHDRVNIEHTWPQSKFSSKFPKEMQKSDMHHLYLTDSHANSTRGNTPFGFIDIFDNRIITDSEGCKSRYGFADYGEVYTPPAPHRGNVARALFYFSMHYNLPISSKEEMVLRKWHKIDPVDDEEIKRHEAIAKYQRVRNPFVDHPEIVDRVLDF